MRRSTVLTLLPFYLVFPETADQFCKYQSSLCLSRFFFPFLGKKKVLFSFAFSFRPLFVQIFPAKIQFRLEEEATTSKSIAEPSSPSRSRAAASSSPSALSPNATSGKILFFSSLQLKCSNTSTSQFYIVRHYETSPKVYSNKNLWLLVFSLKRLAK